MGVLDLGLKLSETMDVNISNCKSFHRIYKHDPQNNYFSLPFSLKSCFLRIFIFKEWRQSIFPWMPLATCILFESFPRETFQIMNPMNPDLDLIL